MPVVTNQLAIPSRRANDPASTDLRKDDRRRAPARSHRATYAGGRVQASDRVSIECVESTIPVAQSRTDVIEPVPDLRDGVLNAALEQDVRRSRGARVSVESSLSERVPSAVRRGPDDQLLMSKVDGVAWLAGGGSVLQVGAQVDPDCHGRTIQSGHRDATVPSDLEAAPCTARQSGPLRCRELLETHRLSSISKRPTETAGQLIGPAIGGSLAGGSRQGALATRHDGTIVAKHTYLDVTSR